MSREATNTVHDFDWQKTRMSANANWSAREFHTIESAPKLYMFTSSTPNRARSRTMSISTMREAGATRARLNADRLAIV